MQDRLRRVTLRAAGHAVGAAFLHPLAKATQVKHILGSAAHAARAFELSVSWMSRSGDPHQALPLTTPLRRVSPRRRVRSANDKLVPP